MLMDSSSRLQDSEQFMAEVRAGKGAKIIQREESSSCSQPALGANWGCTHRHHIPGEPQQAAVLTMVDFADAIRVASRMRGAPVMDTGGCTHPCPKRKTLKSGKFSTADPSVSLDHYVAFSGVAFFLLQ